MTLNVLGAQASVTGTISVTGSGQTSGEITVMTTAASADYVALVTLSMVASGWVAGLDGGLTLPGPGGGVGIYGSNGMGPVSGGGVAAAMSNNATFWAATSTVKVGPGTAVKIPYLFRNANGSALPVAYVVNAHVAYVKNP